MESQSIVEPLVTESDEVPAGPHGDVAMQLDVQVAHRGLQLDISFLPDLKGIYIISTAQGGNKKDCTTAVAAS